MRVGEGIVESWKGERGLGVNEKKDLGMKGRGEWIGEGGG